MAQSVVKCMYGRTLERKFWAQTHAQNLESEHQLLVAMASNIKAMASNLVVMASKLGATASNLRAMPTKTPGENPQILPLNL